jgi:hypothetical protein
LASGSRYFEGRFLAFFCTSDFDFKNKEMTRKRHDATTGATRRSSGHFVQKWGGLGCNSSKQFYEFSGNGKIVKLVSGLPLTLLAV